MKKIFSIFIALLILIETSLIIVSIFIDFGTGEELEESSFLEGDQSWADTLLKHMELDEKIGQLFFIEFDNAKKDSSDLIDSLVINYSIGGVKFKNTELLNQLIISNNLQSQVKYPLFIGSEGSIINNENFNLPIGPIINMANDSVFAEIYLKNFAEILRLENANIDFSNNLKSVDTLNPDIGFSQRYDQMVHQSSFFRKQLHNNHVISCLNCNDSVFNIVGQKKPDSLGIQRQEAGIDKFFAVLQNQEQAKKIIGNKNIINFNKILKEKYNFNGLIICNLPDTFKKEQLNILFKSGTDIFVTSKNSENSISELKKLVKQNVISEKEINNKVKRILMAKKWAGLDKQTFKSAEISYFKIFSQYRKNISWQLYEKSICLIKNQGNSIPISNLLNHGTLIVSVGENNFSILEQYLNYYTNAENSVFEDAAKLKKQISPFRNIIVAIGRPIIKNSKDSMFLNVLKQYSKSKKITIVNFGNPLNIKELLFAHVILQSFDKHPFSQMISAQVIAGAISPKGVLVPNLSGLPKKPSFVAINRFQYTIPEAAGFSSARLGLIDTLIKESISYGATPGCQILAAKNGKIFYYKSFGHHQYFNGQKVDNLDIYDLASITKVAATTFAAMKLYENGKIKLDDSIKYYLDDTIHCTIKNHQLRDFFLHQTGLQPDMPILKYIRYRKKGMGRFDMYYSPIKDTLYSIQVAKDFYLRKDYRDSIVFSLYNLEWDSTKTYRYSDINFNIVYDIILRRLNQDYVKFLNTNVYNPLQLRSIGFLPIDRFPRKKRIAPTQDDKFWRKQLLIGMPHDESAAIYGGVSGNAGLFSNANDLAILFQMLINGGSYGGKKIFEKETIDYFTSKQDNSSRGLGFAWNNGFYGHTGFTGCVVWANPETKMIFIFLSNSVNPKPGNQKLKKMKIRSKILNLILSAYSPEKLNQIEED